MFVSKTFRLKGNLNVLVPSSNILIKCIRADFVT